MSIIVTYTPTQIGTVKKHTEEDVDIQELQNNITTRSSQIADLQSANAADQAVIDAAIAILNPANAAATSAAQAAQPVTP